LHAPSASKPAPAVESFRKSRRSIPFALSLGGVVGGVSLAKALLL